MPDYENALKSVSLGALLQIPIIVDGIYTREELKEMGIDYIGSKFSAYEIHSGGPIKRFLFDPNKDGKLRLHLEYKFIPTD